MLGFRCVALSCLLLAALGARAEEVAPVELLEQMAKAGQSLDYRGSFTYEHSSSMESFRILHWIEDGQVREYLEYLNGPPQFQHHLGRLDGCQTVGLRLLQGGEADAENAPAGNIEAHYDLHLREPERIAGRSAHMLEVRPRDELRYGYLLGIDRETGLLLKAVLIDEQQRVLERFQFADLELNPDIDNLRAQAQSLPQQSDRSGDCLSDLQQTPSRWAMGWLPAGFTYSGEKRLSDNTEMLMYTDGLASFSVFLQPLSGEPRIEGRAQRGATSAFMGQLAASDENPREQTYRVTVVGEIPVAVAEHLARGVSILEAGNDY